ncbi:O-antigen polymerase [Nitrosomonas mobilis]|uniref:O-antigen polymerase n=1 Tax=Nitrosomonas mobilis TaxID=51642 RepID=UPI001C4094CE|nr:O-antigen polymerase [Nitrosomonas mobilis]
MLSFFVFFIVYMPAISVSYFSLAVHGDTYIKLFISLTLGVLVIFFVPRLKLKMVYVKGFSARQFWAIFGFLIVFLSVFVFSFYRLNINHLIQLQQLDALYDIREEYRATSSGIPGLIQYFFTWLIKIVAPFVVIIGLQIRKWYLVVSGVLFTILLFSISGHKSIFLSLFLIFGAWFFMRSNGGATFLRLSLFFFGLTTLGLALDYFGSSLINDVLVRRMLIIPGVLSGYYFEYYGVNEFAMLGYSVLGGLFDYSPGLTPPFIIGNEYFGRAEMSANVNFMASAYADFGVVGVILFSAVAAVLYRFLDMVALQKKISKTAALLVLMPSWALVDSTLLTVLATHGFVLLILIVVLLPRKDFVDR